MKSLILCLLLVGVCVATPICVSRRGRGGTYGWEPTTAPSSSEVLSLKVALRHRNVDKLQEELVAVSDPLSKRYGQHYTREQVADLVGPANKEVNAVVEWLTQAGAEDIQFTFGRETCSFRLSVEKIEKLLSVELMQFKHPKFPSTIIRANSPYCIPEYLDEAVHFVDGLHFFVAPRHKLPTRNKLSPRPLEWPFDPADETNPAFCLKAYQVTEPTSAVRGSSQAPVEFGSNFYNEQDLQQFEAKYAPAVKGQTVEQTYGKGGSHLSQEADVDVQYIIAMGNHVNTSIYYQKDCAGGSAIESCFVTYTDTVLGQHSPPLVHAISYGEYGGNYDNRTVQRLDQNFQKMGLRGISVLMASGDNGVGCNSDCTSFEFDFPSSPHITMVGATYFENGVEKGASLSSGGFSLDYYQPSYQHKAVNDYFNSGVTLPSSKFYDKNGRAYPDVSAAGEEMSFVYNGRYITIDGTSISAPLFGGIISLLNNDRLKNKKSPMGFLNPWLYQNPGMFNTITEGNNKYCTYECPCCPGFDCVKGWDPVTGLGSPNYSKMKQYI